MENFLKNTFNNEAEIYDSTARFLMLNYDQLLTEVVSEIDFSEDDCFCILDAGCGTGNLTRMIRNKFPKATIYGIDFSEDMLKRAERKVDGVTFLYGDIFDAEDLPIPAFDLIVVSFVFHNFHTIKV